MKHLAWLAFAPAFLFLSCGNEKHFINNSAYLKKVEQQFEQRKAEAANRNQALFSVFDRKDLTTEQREALEFLYAYMPLSDLADYDGDFFLKQVNASLAARDTFSWGKTIPEDVFRHFVLVYRINNENLDTARVVFFHELKDRVKNLSMRDAVLETNIWCAEKVSYRGTDGRTSAPLALVRTSWGRCGEESTFTVTALRSIGIPARQCYTPRWVHSDDNHAWVEVWVDGAWHFLGACEPAPELDMGWFAGPATRAMMVHTNVFGAYQGKEEKNFETPLYSKINLLANYADTRPVNVQVKDAAGHPVEGATVKFKVYNYAEFYPLSTNTTDKDGKTSIISGFGDVYVWANKGDDFGYTKSNFSDSNTDVVTVTLNGKVGTEYDETFVMNVPQDGKTKKATGNGLPDFDQKAKRTGELRSAYQATFIKEDAAKAFAKEMKLDADLTWKYLNKATGNWRAIKQFIADHKGNPDLFPFLATLADKDLRDTPAEILNDHLLDRKTMTIKAGTPADMVVPFIMAPRVALELIQPWRSFLQKQWNADEQNAFRDHIASLVEWTKNNIVINDDENYYNCPETPRGVYELKLADSRSRNIFFVAACRSLGIPARVEMATGKTQYFENGQWKDVVFEAADAQVTNLPKVKLTLLNDPKNIVKPAYYSHFTLAFYKDGDFRTLDFDENQPQRTEYPYSLDLDAGYYRLTVGSRASDGSVTVYTRYFELKEGKPLTLTLTMPERENKMNIKGSIDMNTTVTLDNGKECSLKDLANGKGLMLCIVDPEKEPSKHILQDLPAVAPSLEAWGGGVLFMVPDDRISKAFDVKLFKGLPKQTVWGTDNQRKLLSALTSALQLEWKNDFPLTIYLTNYGGILYETTGYVIGTGESVLKTIKLEEQSKGK